MSERYEIHHGDCLEVMATLPDNSVDSIVTDPPYGIGFMGKKWDSDVPGVKAFEQCLRILKPGGHLLAFSSSRTYHRLAVAVEDAGFEIRDQIMWVYGSGFPKSHNVSKAIDKMAGAEREVVGESPYNNRRPNPPVSERYKQAGHKAYITAPATPEAQQWDGWGTSLKPAHEPIVLARKPFKSTVAANVLEHGTGGLNIDGCRVYVQDKDAVAKVLRAIADGEPDEFEKVEYRIHADVAEQGRWPANLIHDGSDEVVGLFPVTGASKQAERGKGIDGATFKNANGNLSGVRGHNDNGGSAARFFYCAKASKADRNEGLEGAGEPGLVTTERGVEWVATDLKNTHVTVKPTNLMRYLCRLITPPGGVILDPFMGSGSGGKGAIAEGFRFIGIEREAETIVVAKARLRHAASQYEKGEEEDV